MGVSYIFEEIPEAITSCKLKDFAGQTAIVDVSCWIYKVISYPVDANQYVYGKLGNLMKHGIRPYVVFDGMTPEAKAEVVADRRRKRQELREQAKEMEDAGQCTEAKRLQRMAEGRSNDIQDGIKQFCKTHNISFIEGPFEADAQIAYLMLKKKGNFVITEDSDLIVYDCKKILFKLSQDEGELYEQAKLEEEWEPFDVQSFRASIICAGCDYLKGGLRQFGGKKVKELYTHMKQKFDYDKMMRYIKRNYKSVEIPANFPTTFKIADNTFKRQLVFDPDLQAVVPLTPYENGECADSFPYAGKLSEATWDFWISDPSIPMSVPVFPGSKKEMKIDPYYCKDCPEIFPSSKQLREHRHKVHPFLCPICGKPDICPAYILDHMDSHMGPATHECDICHKLYLTDSRMRHHKYKQHNGKTFMCEECGRVLTRSDGLSEHQKLCLNRKEFGCIYIFENPPKQETPYRCISSFDTAELLDHHVRRHHLDVARRSYEFKDKEKNAKKAARTEIPSKISQKKPKRSKSKSED